MTSVVVLIIGLWVLVASSAAVAVQGPLVPLGLFELTDEQRKEIRQAQRDYHTRRCDITARMLDAQEDIRALYARDKRDPRQIGQAFRALAALQQQLIEARIEAENRAEAVLSDDQRRQLRARQKRGWGRAYPEWLPYTMHPGIQEERFEPWNLDDPESFPIPPQRAPARPR